jgi:N-acetyl-anhydromuramyl-L-alanine amidase AmpD
MIDLIVVHCSATPPDMDIGADTIRDWHVNDNGWSDIGYHYVIKRNGDMEKGRPDHISGAHVRGHNQGSIGICLIGGVDRDGNPDCNFTQNQFYALEVLLSRLKTDYSNPELKGHRDLDSGKACPSFDVQSWWEETND